LIIAIDGLSGSGKSTLSAWLAAELGVAHLNTGIYFRLAAILYLESKDFDEVAERIGRLPIDIKGERGFIENKSYDMELRSPEVTQIVSQVSAVSAIREAVLQLEREKVRRLGSCVVEGRDIGTVVFPDADYKFFLVASDAVRQARRPEETLLLERDRKDMNRRIAPLVAAQDAFVIDTSDQPVEVLGKRMLEIIGWPITDG
jgi:cytidylate kinase